MAAFVLLAAAAGAGSVTPHLPSGGYRGGVAVGVVNGLHRAFFRCYRAAWAAADPLGGLLVQCGMENSVYNLGFDCHLQITEHLIAFRPVHHQRVTLAVGLQANPSPQVLHGRQVLHPMGVDGL